MGISVFCKVLYALICFSICCFVIHIEQSIIKILTATEDISVSWWPFIFLPQRTLVSTLWCLFIFACHCHMSVVAHKLCGCVSPVVCGMQCLCHLIPYNIFSWKPLLHGFSVHQIFQVVFLSTVTIQHAFWFCRMPNGLCNKGIYDVWDPRSLFSCVASF
jgi:hypothetical protein